MSYCFGMYRDNELKKRGVSNDHGVESAPCESKLRWIEIFVDFTIFGGVIFYVMTLTPDQRHNLPFCIYWLLVDMVIMFFTLPYTKLAQYIQINGEITKNIYTLYQIQQTKLQERRDSVEASDKNAWKKFFTEVKPEKEKPAEDVPKKKKPAMILKNASAPPPTKKKKKKSASYSDQINQENRENEAADENLTSESSDSSSDDESDGEFFLLEQSRHQIVTKELDFDQNEELKFTNDVYNYTICAI